MLKTAIEAARAAGRIQRQHFGSTLQVDERARHDIKLLVDKLCEKEITRIIRSAFPNHALLGEEGGESGTVDANGLRWIIDPLDGTVNFFHNIPHFCCSIGVMEGDKPLLGVIYDPMRDELFAAERGQGATLNGRPMHTSQTADPAEAVIVMGFMKDDDTIAAGLRSLEKLIYSISKMRSTGSAALDLAYVAAGRFTGYFEAGIKLWDVAAGFALLLEAGGRYDAVKRDAESMDVFATNGPVHEPLRKLLPKL